MELIHLIRRMFMENVTWGEPKISSELALLGRKGVGALRQAVALGHHGLVGSRCDTADSARKQDDESGSSDRDGHCDSLQ